MKLIYAHTKKRHGGRALTTHTSLRRARRAARLHSVTEPSVVLERDFETGLSTILEHWQDGRRL